MRVMKFGGSSLITPTRLDTVVDLVREALTQERVIVVTSALAGVTHQLTELVETDGRPTPEFLEGLANRHLDLRGEVTPPGDDFEEKLWVILDELGAMGEEANRTSGWTPPLKDRALGVGERAAALLLSSLLKARGMAAEPIDGPDVIQTDSTFGSARVSETRTRHLARSTLGRILPEVVPVIAGFTGSDEKGRPTTLGRGSSDLSATLVAAALSAREVEIWTDVDGVHDGDPRQDPHAILLPHLDYEEARDMASNGARVLHPRTLDPIQPLGIPLRVRNTLRPDAPGTLVANEPTQSAGRQDCRRVHLILAGATGGVGGAFLKQLQELAPSLKEEGVEVRVSGAFSSRAQLWHPEGIPPEDVPKELVSRAPTDWDEVTRRLVNEPPTNPMFVDCTASPEVSCRYVQILKSGIPVITPNKLAGSGTLAQYRSIRDAVPNGDPPFRYEATVGAALPILRTVRELRQGGDRFRSISGVLSGTLSFVFAKVGAGASFSQAVREARDRGFTEPHPREDLSGTDVARKLLILLREAGFELEPDAIPVESLVPDDLAQEDDPETFLDGLRSFDGLWATRIREADGKTLSYVAWFDGERAGVGVRTLPTDHPLSALRPMENMVILETDRYLDVPLTIAGPGAGREVTASGVLADFLAAIRERYGARRVA